MSLSKDQKDAVEAAEKAIQAIIIGLYNDHDLTTVDVQVDCRNHANHMTQVFVEGDDFV